MIDGKEARRPKHFGGLGGVQATIPLSEYEGDEFVQAVNRALGEKMRGTNDLICAQMWSALANQDWHHDNGDTAGYSFRAAGDLIASIRGQGDYMDWYCSGPYETVSDEIRDALAAEGWYPDERVDL